MIKQRRTHRLHEWQYFCVALREQLVHAHYLQDCFIVQVDEV
jgi:hypothetical protein